ncbi:MAG TPA: flagellar basal body P-ring formation chaperone FlgA [Terriglobia bacterium]|jgi:flagella basal body P-ring formation protein FlgA|nr:flagellar basal body P-ring formation chaperone FlgA [Terriglobia bacterium]
MRIRYAIAVAAIFSARCACAAEAARVLPQHRVPLLSNVVLRSGNVTLDDLLPQSAPAALHDEARRISLGQSPQPPGSRALYREQLQFLLRDHPSLTASLEIPSQIVLRRASRQLSRAEIIRAINSALGRQNPEGENRLDPQQVQLSVPVYVTTNDPGLEVLRISPYPLRGDTQFVLWTSNEPNILPFTVTVQRVLKLPALVTRRALPPGKIVSPADFAMEMRPQQRNGTMPFVSTQDLAGLETRAAIRAGQPVDLDLFKRPVLVKPGALATLIVHGRAFSIKTVVEPLEQGVLGQEIRVRNTETRQVVQARVVGRDRLMKSLRGED